MQADPFKCYLFEPLRFDRFRRHFKETVRSIELARVIFDRWLDAYHHKASLFYHAQYQYKEKLADREFRRLHGIRVDLPVDDYGLGESWQAFRSRIGLESYYEAYRSLSRYVDPENESRLHGAGHSDQFYARLNGTLDAEGPRPSEVNGLWFNVTITNSATRAAELHKLPYNLYLRTEHWAKVRAAQLLIHKAVCQAEACFVMGESWYSGDWEADINVHHLTYDNRGNERYSDLVLLCTRHHQEWHSARSSSASPPFAILDDE